MALITDYPGFETDPSKVPAGTAWLVNGGLVAMKRHGHWEVFEHGSWNKVLSSGIRIIAPLVPGKGAKEC